MKMVFKKAVSVLLAAGLLLASAAGCSSKSQPSQADAVKAETGQPVKTDDKKATETPKASAPPATGLPIVTKPTTITIFTGVATTQVKNNNELEVWKELERRTGVHVEFRHPPLGQDSEQFNLMIASGDFADLIQRTWSQVPGGPKKFIDDGVIIDLKEAIGKWAPNLTKILEQQKVVKKSITTDEGEIYHFPFIQKPDPKQVVYGGLMIRKDWLDKLSLKVPVTLDEWYSTLTAFKTKDPNGNGQDDEIPLHNAWIKGSGSDLTSLNVFLGAWGINGEMMIKNNKILFGPLEPGYREWLATMAKWYKEGLIDPDYLNNDIKAIDNIVLGNRGGVFAELGQRTMEKYLRLGPETIKDFDLVGAPWPTGKDTTGYANYQRLTAMDGHKGVAVSTNGKKNLEVITKWADYWFSPEGTELINFGIKGKSYEIVNGKPKYTDEVMKNPKFTIEQMFEVYRMNNNDPMGVETWDAISQGYTHKQTFDAIDTWVKGKYDILQPVLLFKSGESQRLASIMNDINTYMNERRDKIIMGLEPVDSYDKVVETLKKMNVEEAIKIYQASYDRYMKK